MNEPDTSFEFICEWFEKARENAEKQGRDDSARLWADGLQHLNHLKAENELKLAPSEARELCDALEIYSDFFDEASEEYILLKSNNPSLLGAYETIFTIANMES